MLKTEAIIINRDETSVTLEVTVPTSIFSEAQALHVRGKMPLWVSNSNVVPADPKEVLNELLARVSDHA